MRWRSSDCTSPVCSRPRTRPPGCAASWRTARGRPRSRADENGRRVRQWKTEGSMTQPDDAPSLELVAAALRADSADVAIYARVLASSLGETLPPGAVAVERERSVS